MWVGQGESLSFELCQSIQQLLLSDDAPAWLTKRGTEVLSIARNEMSWLRNSAAGCILSERGLEWHTYAGGYLNLVISRALATSLPANTQSNDFEVVIDRDAHTSFASIREHLEPLSNESLLISMRPPSQWLTNLKSSACLPDQIARRVFVERLNVRGWDELKNEWFEKTRTRQPHINSKPVYTFGPKRRLLLTNYELGAEVHGKGVQLGLNFADTAPELFADKRWAKTSRVC